jgi:hypothetical protein
LQEELRVATLRRCDLADVWLLKAVVHLMRACDVPDWVVSEFVVAGKPPSLAGLSREPPPMAAFVRRLDESRVSVLYAAVAAETHLNRYIAVCGPGYSSMVARVPLAERFVLAAAMFAGPDLLAPGRELQQEVAELFALRDGLSDSRPAEMGAADRLRETFMRFSPRVACRMVEVSARVAQCLAERCTPSVEVAAGLALEAADLLAKRAEAASAEPDFTDEELKDAAWRAVVRFPEAVIGD